MSKGISLTPEHKRKLSLAKKGKPSGRKGEKFTEERKRKIGLGNKGKTVSKEAKLKMSLAKKGKKLTEEHRQKISNSHKGKTFSEEHRKNLSQACKGRKHTEETKQKIREIRLAQNKALGEAGRKEKYGRIASEEKKLRMSESHKGYHPSEETIFKLKGHRHTEEAKKKIGIASKNRKREPHSEETKLKMSLAKRGKPGPWKGKHRSAETIRKVADANRGKKRKPHSEETKKKISLIKKEKFRLRKENGKAIFKRSKPEIEFGKQIEKYFGVTLQHSKWIEGRCFDYCYKPKRILIECDGSFWHNREDTKKIDELKNEIAKNNGYKLIRCVLNTIKDVDPYIINKYDIFEEIFKVD